MGTPRRVGYVCTAYVCTDAYVARLQDAYDPPVSAIRGYLWLELRRLPPIMGFVGSEGQGW